MMLCAPVASASAAQAARAVTNVAFTPSTTVGDLSGVVWPLRFTATHALIAGSGTVTVSAPTGTSFADVDNVQVFDLHSGQNLEAASCQTGNDATSSITCTVGEPVAAGEVVSYVLEGVSNPASGTALSGVSLSTSSDDVPVSVPSGASFTTPQPVSDLSFTPSTTAGGATNATSTLAFTTSSTGDLSDRGATITIHAPAGASFSHATATADDVTTGDYLSGNSSAGNRTTFTYTVGSRVRAGEDVLLLVQGVANPMSGTAFSDISLSTSSDIVPVSTSSDTTFAPAATVGRVAVAVSSTVAAANAQWTYTTTTSDSGALGAGSGTITLTAPESTVFGSDAADYTVNGTAVTAVPRLTGTDEVTLTVPSAVAADSALQVVATSVTGPASDAYPATSTTAGGAIDTTWSVAFTASGRAASAAVARCGGPRRRGRTSQVSEAASRST